jgi:hypothetical protein
MSDTQPDLHGLEGRAGLGNDRSWTTTYNFTAKEWVTTHPGGGRFFGKIQTVIYSDDIIIIREIQNVDGSDGVCWLRRNGNVVTGTCYRASGITNADFQII